MTWEKFVVIWSKYLNTSIPQESIREWQKFAKTADDAVLTEAVNVLADKYQAAADKGNNKAPTLYQLANAYGEIFREKRGTKSFTGCEFCEKEASATVYVIDIGNYSSPDFPPDPVKWDGRRNLCVVPCPCCRATEYADMGLRDRVLKNSRPFSRRNELLKMREVSA
jgi:hypothetical protein